MEKSKISEWGFVRSHFIHESGQFSSLNALTEKVDNAYSGGASFFKIF